MPGTRRIEGENMSDEKDAIIASLQMIMDKLLEKIEAADELVRDLQFNYDEDNFHPVLWDLVSAYRNAGKGGEE